ncbi:MAG: tetratricopeptide repeat protein [Pseudohongiella sp.]
MIFLFNNIKRSVAARLMLVTACFFTTQYSLAQPYTPESDSSVVEVLPAAIIELSADIRELQASEAGAGPVNAPALLQLAMESYQLAASSGEARAYGRTLSILQRWPEGTEKPATYHILMAAVLQHNHEFNAALEHLQPLTSDTNNNRTVIIQSLMMQAQIGLVIGDYDLVEQSCTALRSSARQPVFLNCQAQLDGIRGNAEEALNTLTTTLSNGNDLNALDYQELLTTAAAISHRTGDATQAERYYRAALSLSPGNTYLVVNYSNLLLERGRSADVINLLSSYSDEELNTELRIIMARALRARNTGSDQQRAENFFATLEEDFQLAFLRDEAVPHKEYAQFALYLADLPEAALNAAKDNWQLQKEPSDTLLLASAAAANDDQDTLDEVDRWIRTIGTQDVRLQRLLDSQSEGQGQGQNQDSARETSP